MRRLLIGEITELGVDCGRLAGEIVDFGVDCGRLAGEITEFGVTSRKELVPINLSKNEFDF